MDASALRIDLVVFSVEGTTVRSGDAIDECIRAALIAANVPVKRESVRDVLGMPIPEAIRRLILRSIGPDGAHDDLVSEVHADFLHRITDHHRRGPKVELMPHVEETFFRLKRAGAMVALASAHSRIVLDGLLDRLGWRTTWQIDATVAADEVAAAATPDLIFRAMALTGVRRVEMVTSVGDTPIDLEAVRRRLRPCRGRDERHVQGARTQALAAHAPHLASGRPATVGHRARTDTDVVRRLAARARLALIGGKATDGGSGWGGRDIVAVANGRLDGR